MVTRILIIIIPTWIWSRKKVINKERAQWSFSYRRKCKLVTLGSRAPYLLWAMGIWGGLCVVTQPGILRSCFPLWISGFYFPLNSFLVNEMEHSIYIILNNFLHKVRLHPALENELFNSARSCTWINQLAKKHFHRNVNVSFAWQVDWWVFFLPSLTTFPKARLSLFWHISAFLEAHWVDFCTEQAF